MKIFSKWTFQNSNRKQRISNISFRRNRDGTNLVIDKSSPEEETDGAIELIKNIVDNVRSDIENLVENNNLKKFLHILTKIFTLLLNVKVDNSNKIIKIVKLAISSILRKWSEQN